VTMMRQVGLLGSDEAGSEPVQSSVA
jgi:hypothetical protein